MTYVFINCHAWTLLDILYLDIEEHPEVGVIDCVYSTPLISQQGLPCCLAREQAYEVVKCRGGSLPVGDARADRTTAVF